VSAAIDRQRELLRQQGLLRALNGAGRAAVQGWTAQPSRQRHDLERGLQAYLANAAASAERALAARHPTVQQLMGDEAFAALARHLWRLQPPRRGDLAQWGHGLPDFIATNEQLAGEPYLADVARLDAAVHEAEQALDATADPASLILLTERDADAVTLRLAPGCACIDSPHPLAAIWQAHHGVTSDTALGAPGDDRFAAVRQAFAQAAARPDPQALLESAWVWREGWTVHVQALAPAGGAFVRALADGASLARALDLAQAVGPFDFEAWLVGAVHDGAVLGAQPLRPL
jgi:hypothetical protein